MSSGTSPGFHKGARFLRFLPSQQGRPVRTPRGMRPGRDHPLANRPVRWPRPPEHAGSCSGSPGRRLARSERYRSKPRILLGSALGWRRDSGWLRVPERGLRTWSRHLRCPPFEEPPAREFRRSSRIREAFTPGQRARRGSNIVDHLQECSGGSVSIGWKCPAGDVGRRCDAPIRYFHSVAHLYEKHAYRWVRLGYSPALRNSLRAPRNHSATAITG